MSSTQTEKTQPKPQQRDRDRERRDPDEPDTRTRKERKEDELKKLEENAVEAPQSRYFTISIDLIAETDNEDVSAAEVERAALDQLIFPTQLGGYQASLNVVGGNVTGSSESKEAPSWEAGFGLAATGTLHGAPAKTQERLSPPEAVVGEVAVFRGSVLPQDAPGASPQTTVQGVTEEGGQSASSKK